MAYPRAREQDLHPDEFVAWAAVPLARALAAHSLSDDDDEVDAGWQLMRWRPKDGSDNGVPRGTAVGGLARRLMALERARLRRRAPLMAPQGRRNGGRAGRGS